MPLLTQISENMQKGSVPKVREGITLALDEGIAAKDILDSLVEGMNVIGGKFKNNEIYVPEVMIAARAMNAGLEILKPILTETGVKPIGKMVLGTVAGDIHDIGKNLVKMMVIGAGMEVIDLGTDVSPEKFVNAVAEHQPEVIGMSALLTTTMLNMRKTITALEEAGFRSKVTIMIGGAPVTENFAAEIGADLYAPDAATAAWKAREVVLAMK